MGDDADVWSQLVHLTDIYAPVIPINKEKFVIGRNSENCDLAHQGNKLVSGRHCYIERDDEGKVWLYDTSTNGTLLNLNVKITKGECRQLNHGDEIHIVYKKDEPEQNIGYMFQDKIILDQAGDSDSEDEATQEYDREMDQTLSDAFVNDVPSPVPSSAKKRTAKVDDVEETGKPAEKSQKLEPQLNIKPTSNTEPKPIHAKSHEDGDKDKKPDEPDDSAMLESLVCIICQELLHDCISLQPCMHSFCAGCYSEWMEKSQECPSCRTKVDRINKNHLVNNLVEAFLKGKPGFKRPEEDLKELDAKNKITRDMLYPDKIRDESQASGSEYSDDAAEEEDEESQTPAPNPLQLNPQPYILPNPNTGLLFGAGTPFFGTAMPPAVMCRQCPGFNISPQARSLASGIQHLFSATMAYIRTVLGGPSTPANTSGDLPGANDQASPGPSTSTTGTGANVDPDAKVLPENPPAYTCLINNNHVLCLCCMQPMPDRRREFRINEFPPQQLCLGKSDESDFGQMGRMRSDESDFGSVCFRAFCHAYWGCLKMDCMGCLGNFRDMNFGKKCLTSILMDNAYESEILKHPKITVRVRFQSRLLQNYLEEKGVSVKQLLAECVAKVNTGEYTFQNQMRFTYGMNTPVCYNCGFQAFKELVYQYRKDIPNDQLRAEAVNRPKCYWGKNCRTQRNKPEHAARFNHICEQTRTL